MPATVKVYVPTFRRPRLLARALASLRAQTFRDWIAEVRNDDPADPAPAVLVAALGDPRIVCVNHPRNLGALATFNICYGPGPEPFMALLEDDNAWEPAFLSTLLAALKPHPHASLVWCNQSIDEELPDGGIRSIGRTVHLAAPGGMAPGLHYFGEIAQAFGALHANGAMILRRPEGDDYITPPIAFTGIEAWRERLMPGPMLYIAEPLGRFTLTRQTSRSGETRAWAVLQLALIASFVRALDPARDAELWRHARDAEPSMTGSLIQAALADSACRRLLREARPREWARWMLGTTRHPRLALASLRFRRAPWWPEIAAVTAKRLSARP